MEERRLGPKNRIISSIKLSRLTDPESTLDLFEAKRVLAAVYALRNRRDRPITDSEGARLDAAVAAGNHRDAAVIMAGLYKKYRWVDLNINHKGF